MGRRRKEPDPDPETFEVSVWDHEGNVIKKLWEATAEEVEALRDEYEPEHVVVIDDRR